MKKGQYCPWGCIQQVSLLAEGIEMISTARHGGVKLDRKRNAMIPEYMRSKGGWYEEDCAWSIPAVNFKDAFEQRRAGSYENAVKTLKNWYYKFYEQHFGVELAEGESREKDRDLFISRNKENFIVISAQGSWCGCPEGMVKVTAKKGGRENKDGVCIETLVSSEDYEKRGPFGYVLNPVEIAFGKEVKS